VAGGIHRATGAKAFEANLEELAVGVYRYNLLLENVVSVCYNPARIAPAEAFSLHKFGTASRSEMRKLTSKRFRVTPPFWLLGNLYLKLFGWKVEGDLPPDPKYVLIVAPHTSNWDFPHLLAASFLYRVHAHWLGKQTIFCWPFGWMLRRLGGIPIDRESRHDIVEQAVQAFSGRDKFILGVAPEGTRSRTDYWKTGFYHIARGAQVPILLVSIDYGRKTCSVGRLITPSGDLEADMETIRDFYSTVQARHPEKRGKIEVDPGSEPSEIAGPPDA